MGPRTFATVQEFLWCNCSPVCGLSALWLCGGTDGDLLQEDLCHTLYLPGLLQPEALSPWQATADPASAGDTQTLRGRPGSVFVGSLGPGAHKVLFEPSKHLWWVGGLILNAILTLLPILLGLLLCPWMWGIFFWWDPIVSCQGEVFEKLQNL